MNNNWIGSRRPYLKEVEGKVELQSFAVQNGRVLPSPMRAVMTKDQWIAADRIVCRVFNDSTPLLQAILKRKELVISDFDAVGKMVLEYRDMNDTGEAVINVGGLTQGRHDEPAMFTMRAVPLPFTSIDIAHFENVNLFLEQLPKRVKSLAASVESQIRQALPINAQTLQIELTPATFRLIMGMPPQLLQQDGRVPEFVVTCIIVPDDRTKPGPTTLSEAMRSFDLASQRCGVDPSTLRVNEVVEDVSIGIKTDMVYEDGDARPDLTTENRDA